METDSIDILLGDAVSEATVHTRFARRPDQIPADLRLPWRLGALCLVLSQCRGKSAYFEQIHLLIWSLRSELAQQTLQRWFRGDPRPDDIIVRFDPSLSRTIAIAAASELVERRPQGVALTTNGKEFAAAIRADDGVMQAEKHFLSTLPAAITQKSVRDLLERR